MENEEKRMAGDYEISQALRVGDCEVVMGKNPTAEKGQKYMVSFCHSNDIFRSYDEVLVSDNFTEIAGIFGKLTVEMSEKVRSEVQRVENEIDTTPLTEESCLPLSYHDDINNKVVAMKPDILRPEYRRADCQIYLVTGGFGASANSRGSAVYCTNLYTGKETRFDRADVQGIIKPEMFPEWAKKREAEIRFDMHRPKEKDSTEVR